MTYMTDERAAREAAERKRMMNPMATDKTLRDYFAAKVLVTACGDYGPFEAAEIAYRYADAMLEARK